MAHALKGSISNLSSGPARELAAELEQLGKRGDLEGAPAVVERLEHDLTRLQQAAEQLLNRPLPPVGSRRRSSKSATRLA